MGTRALPRIALDPLVEAVAEIEIGGAVYRVVQVTAQAYQGALLIQEAQAKQEAPDPEVIFSTARALVPDLPKDVTLNIKQSMAIILAASGEVDKVAALFPKGPGRASRPRASRR